MVVLPPSSPALPSLGNPSCVVKNFFFSCLQLLDLSGAKERSFLLVSAAVSRNVEAEGLFSGLVVCKISSPDPSQWVVISGHLTAFTFLPWSLSSWWVLCYFFIFIFYFSL